MLSRHEAGCVQGLAIVRLSRSAFANQPAKAAAVTERSKRGVAAKAVVFFCQAKDESRTASALVR